jgi:hypothetical protein
MLSEGERRLLAGIESQLSESAPGLDRRMRIHAWRSTPHEPTPRLPVVLLVVGVLGLIGPTFASTPGVAFLLALGSMTLIVYGLFHLPVHPCPRLGPDEGREREAD